MSPLQQQRPLVGDGLRLWAVWWEGDKFLSVPARSYPPAEAKRRAGIPKDFAAQGLGLGYAVRDNILVVLFIWKALVQALPTPKASLYCLWAI